MQLERSKLHGIEGVGTERQLIAAEFRQLVEASDGLSGPVTRLYSSMQEMNQKTVQMLAHKMTDRESSSPCCGGPKYGTLLDS